MSLRDLERESIRAFVQDCADKGYLSGRVLDYGAGNSPYADIVRAAGGEYVAYDRTANPGSCTAEDVGPEHPLVPRLGMERWDAILCTQVLQYVPDWWNTRRMEFVSGPADLLEEMGGALEQGGKLLLTVPTNWPVVEKEDLHRFTVEGVRSLLDLADYSRYTVKERAHVVFEGEKWSLGCWAVAESWEEGNR